MAAKARRGTLPLSRLWSSIIPSYRGRPHSALGPAFRAPARRVFLASHSQAASPIPRREDTGPWRLTPRGSPSEGGPLNDVTALGRNSCAQKNGRASLETYAEAEPELPLVDALARQAGYGGDLRKAAKVSHRTVGI